MKDSLTHRIFPLYSKRRFIVKFTLAFFTHPFRFLSKISPKRLIRFFHVLKTNGTAEVLRRVNNHVLGKLGTQYSLDIYLFKVRKTKKSINKYEPIVFKRELSPVVSIIIPVFNNFNYTYNCLRSINKFSGEEVKYEVIIADDCSNDLTTRINELVSNVKMVRTKRNIGFLKNCNNAAKQANGKYILFLNNDTQVQNNWLSPLVQLIGKDSSIGAVGSKLIFKNEMLQEAGGIYWKDASAWNYGRMNDPTAPEFNYIKEVDYVSGAALMIKKSLWKTIGGFDEDFSPAYCEDADICFSIRKFGCKVMYQPASIVVHFEGITNGTDISKGQKQYQTLNQKNFFNKWRSILEDEHFPNGEKTFQARDRSRNKKVLLFVDHYVPHFDRDAGSRAAFQYLKLFANLGFNIKFLGDDFFRHEPYTTTLEQLGIEVLYGPYYAKDWKIWLRENGRYIDFVILSRPHVSVKYIDAIKENSCSKTFYLGHDLHFLRDSREYELTHDAEKLTSAEKWKELELSLIKKSDAAYFFSTVETAIINEILPETNCRVIPLNIFQKSNLNNYNIRIRNDLVFVGGFKHPPNADGIIWFINEIMPAVTKVVPEIELNIIGSDVPDEVKKLKNDNINILGYVDDATLDKYYNNCRICVAPLRYGAGVKGKILEAMYKQIPVITTSIGAEGLPDISDCLMIEDKPEQYAQKLIEMYNNELLLKTLTEQSFQYIMKNFTTERVMRVINEDFAVKATD